MYSIYGPTFLSHTIKRMALFDQIMNIVRLILKQKAAELRGEWWVSFGLVYAVTCETMRLERMMRAPVTPQLPDHNWRGCPTVQS